MATLRPGYRGSEVRRAAGCCVRIGGMEENPDRQPPAQPDNWDLLVKLNPNATLQSVKRAAVLGAIGFPLYGLFREALGGWRDPAWIPFMIVFMAAFGAVAGAAIEWQIDSTVDDDEDADE